MADYRKMYGLLCRAVDAAIEPIRAAGAAEIAAELEKALLQAEEIYLETAENTDCQG